MEDHIDEILIPRQSIAARVYEMAGQIAADLRRDADGEPQVAILAVLTGSLIFLADLIRQMPLMMRIRLLAVSSYRGRTTAPGELLIDRAMLGDLRDQHVLIVDDVLDSGATLTAVQQTVFAQCPASLRTCVLLRKDTVAAQTVRADYVGFDIPDKFVVGYGLDHDGHYRNLPDIVTLRPEVLA